MNIKKLPNLVKGMKIKVTTIYALNYDICIQGKMSNDRNKTLDCKAAKFLALVHSDLAGSIQPLAKDCYKYVINFIDDYSGLTMLYFLKHKSDTLPATTKYLADIAPYGHVKCLRTDNGMGYEILSPLKKKCISIQTGFELVAAKFYICSTFYLVCID